MTKNRSKFLIILFSILLVISLIACFVNFTIPFSINGNYYSYSNFVSNLKLGEDVSSSLRIIYRAEQNEDESEINYNELRESTMLDLKDIVSAEGYKDVSVSTYGDDGIVINIGNLINKEDKDAIESLIGNPVNISFSFDAEKKDIYATADDIKNVTAGSNVNEKGEMVYFTMVQFNSDVEDVEESKTVYINIGENQIQWTYGIQDGMLPISLQGFSSMLDATTFANQIKAGMLDLSLTQISSDYISPNYGEFATLLLSIAMAVLVIGAFVFLIVKYRSMGWISCFNLLFFVVIGLFLLQSIPLVHINLAGLIAMLVCFLIATDSLVMILEKAKRNYQNGAQLYVALREAQKDSLFKILFLNALLLISGFICLFMPVASIRSFGWVALVLSIVATFTTLALMRLFIKMYLAFNNENGKKCNFHKGGKNA